MTFRIRSLTQQDYPQVYEIHQRGLDTGNGAYDRQPDSWEAFSRKKYLDFCFVAVDEVDGQERILGWVSLMPFGSREALSGLAEDSIYVDPAAAGRGVGTALLEHVIDAARQSNGRVWSIVASIFTENEASIRLHEKVGFERLGVFRRHGYMEYGPWEGQVRSAVFYEFLIDPVA